MQNVNLHLIATPFISFDGKAALFNDATGDWWLVKPSGDVYLDLCDLGDTIAIIGREFDELFVTDGSRIVTLTDSDVELCANFDEALDAWYAMSDVPATAMAA